KEDAVLVARRHLEIAEDQDENEEVIDRERFFYEISGQILGGRLRAELIVDKQIEQKRQRDPDAAPDRRLLGLDLMCLAMEDPEIDHQQYQHKCIESHPPPYVHRHVSGFGCSVRSIMGISSSYDIGSDRLPS